MPDATTSQARLEAIPPFTAKLGNEAVEIAYRPQWRLGGLTVAPSARGGVLAPVGTTGVPYSTLGKSPYGAVDLQARYRSRSHIEALVIGTLGYTQLNTHKGVYDPTGAAASPASDFPARDRFTQNWMSYSGYADVGYIAPLSPALKAAFFASVDGFYVTVPDGLAVQTSRTSGVAVNRVYEYEGQGLGEGNVGSMVMYKKGANEASVFGDFRLEGANKNMFRNYQPTLVPAATGGAEYARMIGNSRLSAGVETSVQPADVGVRPYINLTSRRASALLAGDYRQSRDSFYPDVRGFGGEVRTQVAPGVALGVAGTYAREYYSLAPGPEDNYSAMGVVAIDLNKIFRLRGQYRERSRPKTRPVAQDSIAMNERLPGPAYPATFDQTLADSPTYADFVRNAPVKSVDDILAAASAFARTFGEYNFNSDEPGLLNSQDMEQIYAAGRQSYRDHQDNPVLVCIGAAQFVANLANDLASLSGIPLEAKAVGVQVPDDDGGSVGHAVAQIKTKDYGFVFVDWGKLTPTYTFNTGRALEIYQAIQGHPALVHAITTGRDGHPVGYLFSPDAKIFIENLTFHAGVLQPPLERALDAPRRGAPLTVDHMRDRLRDDF